MERKIGVGTIFTSMLIGEKASTDPIAMKMLVNLIQNADLELKTKGEY